MSLLVCCGPPHPQGVSIVPPPPPPAVTVSLPVQREVRDWDEYTGHLQAPETVNIQARVSGFIEKTSFREGAIVQKGDVLYEMDARPFEADLNNKKAALAKDEAQVTLTQSELGRSEGLLKTKAIAQQDFDTSRARFDQAKAQLEADKAAADVAQLNMEWTKVTAPITGRVSRMYVTAGNLINGGAGQGTLLTTIVSVGPIYCLAPVPERTFLKYQALAAQQGTVNLRDAKIPCYVQLENETNFPHQGVIDFIDNNMDANTGTIQLRGLIPNPDGMLTPGVFARMRITNSKPYQTLLIPDIAVGTEQNERFVLVVGKDDMVETKSVKLGRLFGSLRAISDGLKLEDKVVVNGMQQARPGTQVSPKEVPVSLDSLSAFDVGLTAAAKPTVTAPTTEAAKP
ncbi:MAG: Efflux transporter, family, subunit [Verrucomicrobiaceae bacterium]|nr:Efflux transporter, family, subunit [Verrucomicrobiaceae bacterium]